MFNRIPFLVVVVAANAVVGPIVFVIVVGKAVVISNLVVDVSDLVFDVVEVVLAENWSHFDIGYH